MIDYTSMESVCHQNKEMVDDLADDYLVYYASKNEKLEKEFFNRLSKYRHVTSELEDVWTRRLASQYIAHRIFRKDGLVRKYLKNNALKKLDNINRQFLEQQSKHPWRFSFSMITDNPHGHFYEMHDVFRDEIFLLFSPSVTEILKEERPCLWFNLTYFNGDCWQCYGPVISYAGFEPDDIYFFTTELHPDKWPENESDIIDSIQNNPVPYMMLLIGSSSPRVFNGKDKMIQVLDEYYGIDFPIKGMEKQFIVEHSSGVYRFKLKKFDGPPHFSSAYYNEAEKSLLLYAMTERGYSALIEKLNSLGYSFPDEPMLRVNMAMMYTAGKILKKKIRLQDYDLLFDQTEEPNPEIDKINNLITLLLPEFNDNKLPDIEALSAKTGIDKKIIQDLINHINKLRQKPFN
jgi:hypothetical protein